jgi:hypothetical protein
MPIEIIKNNNIYRNQLPFGHYDLIIISLVHQGPEMVYYMAKNIKKYVKGKFLWVAHYNNSIQIDENTLPEWAWLVRDTIKTERSTRLLTMAINQALKFILVNVSSTNIMTLSSGSAFFREFVVPTEQKVSLISHELKKSPLKNYAHIQEIEISHLGNCTKYLESVGSFGWQYKFGGDKDLEFHKLIKNRGFKYIRGCQWPGQIWPYEVGKNLLDDLTELEGLNDYKDAEYACEEIYLSTYAYNYAKENNMSIDYVEVIIDWESGYEVRDYNYVQMLRKTYEGGTAVCKLSDNILDNVRVFIING